TSKELPKNADLVLFQANAPSASFLLGQHFMALLPLTIQVLAQLTVITDTAAYTTPPPTESPKDLDKATEEELAWLLDDLCRTVDTPEEILTLIQDLSSRQLHISDQPEYQERLNKLYGLRKQSFEIADGIPPADVIIIIQGKTKVLTSSLVNRLFQKDVKITCVLYPGKRFTGLSFRVSSDISDSDLSEYRVDTLAADFSGGGHPRAAGGRSNSLEEAVEFLNGWIKEKHLSKTVYDLRTK
ncbi:MAG: hypothetical protein ACW98F_17985, partial [Candidatus Hodarchaeales archaeon]